MCGVVGVYGHPEAANLAYLGLYALQHRGQESPGIVSTDGAPLPAVREMRTVHLIARSREQTLPDRAADALRQVRGAYSLVFLTESSLVAVRDPMGFRPLALGKSRVKGKEFWVVSSETCAFELLEAEFVRDIE